jgi:hypothetical protein
LITFAGNHPQFSSKLNEFLASRASTGGLPKDILLLAYKDYKQEIVPWEFVVERAQQVHDELKKRMPEAIFVMSVHESGEVGEAAVGLSAYHMSAGKMESSEEAFLNGATNTFVFWRWGVWLLQTNDVVGATGHLHRRIMTRDSTPDFSFTGLHDAVSSLWPALVEVGQVRRQVGELANITFFSVPYSSGLICAEFQKLQDSHKFRSILRILDKQKVRDLSLPSPFSSGDDHLLVIPKTYITRLNANQKKLHSLIEAYLQKHKAATVFLKRRSRLLYDSSRVGKYMRRTFNDESFEMDLIRSAIADLDSLTRSPEWITESERNRRSAERSQANATQSDE